MRFRKPHFQFHCTKSGCKRFGKTCLGGFLIFNNTPFGFLGEHMFWEKIPYMWHIPQFLGIH